MQLTESQSRAVEIILDDDQPVSILSGAAGTGKTTVISTLVDALDDVEVCTPTNKAAQVLSTKGLDAATFYRRFFIPYQDEDRNGRPILRFISCADAIRQGQVTSAQLGDKREFADTIIVDEASMVTSRQIAQMRSMCNRLILVGDRHQLPPVNDQDYPAGFFATKRPTAELTEIMRQAEGSPILELANEIRLGGKNVDRLLRGFEPPGHFMDWFDADRALIAFTNRERQAINIKARKVLGFDKPYPMPGDRVVGTSNYSDEFLNGTPAEVIDFSWDGRSALASVTLRLLSGAVTLDMAMRPFIMDQPDFQQQQLTRRDGMPPEAEELAATLTFGYCLTAHKAQGSEWSSVGVIDQRWTIQKTAKDKDGFTPEEYVRRWLYTAITRARKDLTFAAPFWVQAYRMGDAA